MTPALELLRRFFPDAEISVLVRSGTEAVLENNPFIKQIYAHGEITGNKRMHKSTRSSFGKRLSQLPGGWRVIRKLRRQHFDLAIDFNGSDRAAILTFLSGAKERAGFSSPGGFIGKPWLFTELHPPPPQSMHRVLKLTHLVSHVARRRSQSVPTEPAVGPLVLIPAADDLRWAEDQWNESTTTGGLRVLLHPTSRVAFKCWLPPKWAEVIGQLQKSYGARVMVTCGPDAAEIKMAEQILNLCSARPIARLGGMSLGRLAALMQRANLFLGVDSAPMHMAAAVGTPLIALFGPSDDHVWGPWGQTDWVLRRPCVCLETKQRHCVEEQGMKCLNEISVEELLDRVRARLAANSRNQARLQEIPQSLSSTAGPTF